MQPENRRRRRKLPGPWWCGLAAVLLLTVAVALLIWVPYAQAKTSQALLTGAGFEVFMEPRGPAWFIDWLKSYTGLNRHVGSLFQTRFRAIRFVQEDESQPIPDLSLLRRIEGLSDLELFLVRVTASDIEHFQHLQSLEQLTLLNVVLTDEAVRLLSGFKKLDVLSLYECQCDSLSQPLKLPLLYHLVLDGAGIGDKHLDLLLDGLPNLTMLHLERTKSTDAGLVHVHKLDKLEMILLNGSPITEHGLMQLASLPSLISVAAWNTQITHEGAQKFVERVPKAMVHLGDDGKVYGAEYEPK
ncbi:MAG: hypothetical protein AB7Q45_23835 [Planctomycetaceae bacterium]